MKHIKTIFITLLVLLTCSLMLVGCGRKANALDYVDITFSGSNGNGRAELSMRTLELIESVIGGEPEPNESYSSWLSQYILYDEGITFSCTPEQNLSNGDTVTVSVTVSDAAAKTIKGGEKKFTVSGLPEMQTVDFFRDIAIRYEGIGGQARAILERETDEEALTHCDFQVEPAYGIQNGDTVTVTIANEAYLEQEYLCRPAETSKTFSVSGLDEYLTDPDLLPEDDIQALIRQFLEQTHPKEDSIFTYSAPQYYKTYLLTKNPESYYPAESENALEIYVCYDEYMNGVYHWTVYTPLVFRNLILHPDGTVDGLDYESGSDAVFYTEPEQIINRSFNAYSIEEVYIEY